MKYIKLYENFDITKLNDEKMFHSNDYFYVYRQILHLQDILYFKAGPLYNYKSNDDIEIRSDITSILNKRECEFRCDKFTFEIFYHYGMTFHTVKGLFCSLFSSLYDDSESQNIIIDSYPELYNILEKRLTDETREKYSYLKNDLF